MRNNIVNYLATGLLVSSLTSCETRKVEYSGINDLVIGAQQVVLYDNNEFYLELGAGGTEGTYSIVKDTVNLEYFDQSENWPAQLLMTEAFFQTIPTDQHKKSIKIKRN